MRDNEQACINSATFNDDVAQNLATSSLDEASSFAYCRLIVLVTVTNAVKTMKDSVI